MAKGKKTAWSEASDVQRKFQSRCWETCWVDTGVGETWWSLGSSLHFHHPTLSHFALPASRCGILTLWGLGELVMTAVPCTVPKDCCTE